MSVSRLQSLKDCISAFLPNYLNFNEFLNNIINKDEYTRIFGIEGVQ